MSKRRPPGRGPFKPAPFRPPTAAGSTAITLGSAPRTEPSDARAKGLALLQSGDLHAALPHLVQAAEQRPEETESWLNLAVVHRALRDFPAMLAALDKTLELEPRELIALLMKGSYYDDIGDLRTAGPVFSAALAIAPPINEVPVHLRPLIERAAEVRGKFVTGQAAAIDKFVSRPLDRFSDARLERFRQSVDVFLGRKRMYQRMPHSFYFPGLPEVQYYDRRDFPWLAEIEAATPEIREEFLDILRRNEGFEPYIQYPPGTPLNQWAELNRNPRWSAYHLYKDGAINPEHAAHCPKTMSLMAKVPAAMLPRRSPSAMFSVLQPHTRIPPHTGVTNVRLVVHIPLIIPPDCLFRVGNDVREWKMGEAFVFDDTIDHEAVNNSDQVRVVLIFDIWHPDITPAERELIGAFFDGVDEFMGDPVAT